MATLFSTVNRPEHEMTQGLIPEKRSSRTSVPNASYKKGNSRVSRKSKYSPAKRRLRNSDDFNKSSRSSHIAVGMQDIVNLVREKKRREAMDTLVNLVEEEILHKMMRAESGQQSAQPPAKRKKLFALRDFNVLIKELGDRGHLNECEEVLGLMKLCAFKPSLVTYSTLISRAGAWQKVQLAEKYFDEMRAEGIRPDVLAYNSLINAYAKSRLADKALGVLKLMDREGVLPSVVTFNTLIDCFARGGEVLQASLHLREMGKRGLQPNERSYSSLVHAYCEAGRVEEAKNLVESMASQGVTPTAVTYSLLLHALGQAGQLSDAFRVLDTMKERGIKPNVVTMSSLIYACGKVDQLERAFTLLETMKEGGEGNPGPNSITYSTLVDACLKAGKVNRAFHVVREMRSNGKDLTEVTYTSLISELTRLKQLDRITEIVGGEGAPLSALRSTNRASSGDTNNKGKQPEDAFFPSSAKSLRISGSSTGTGQQDTNVAFTSGSPRYEPMRQEEWDSLRALFQPRLSPERYSELETLQERAEEIDDALKSISHVVRHKGDLVCGASSSVTIEALEDLFSVALELRDRQSSGPDGTYFESFDKYSAFILSLVNLPGSTAEADVACGALLRAFGRYLHLWKAMKFVTALCRSADLGKREVYLGRLDGMLRKMNAHSLTVSAFERLKKKGEDLNARVYNELMRSLSAQRKVVQDQELFRLYLVFQEMGMGGVEADTSTYNTLINACATVGDVNKALETMQVMQRSQCDPDVITYTSLIKACSINGAPGTVSLAETLFQEMQQRTNHFSSYIEPTEYTYLRLMQTHLACAEEGEMERIWSLAQELLSHTPRPSRYTWRTCSQAALQDGDVARALEYVDRIRSSTKEGYDDKTWAMVIDACETKGRREEAAALRAESSVNQHKN